MRIHSSFLSTSFVSLSLSLSLMDISWVLLLAAAAVLVQEAEAAVAAATYTVGAPDGLWDLQTNYGEWVAGRAFHPGDKITFTYSPELHDVVEVSKAGFDACSSTGNISAFRSGNDVVSLTTVGTRYFLCGLTGHCDSGMKIRINVVAAGSGSGPGPAAPPSTSGSAAAAAGSIGLAAVVAVALHHLVAL